MFTMDITRMTNIDPHHLIEEFDAALRQVADAGEYWRALHALYDARIGCKLFTVTTVDMAAGLARRVFTSHPVDYPVSGTKPITRDAWFDIVHGERRLFVANSIAEIAAVFPDHEKIAALGCASVVNVPVVIDGELAATVNALDVAGHYTPERVALIERHLTVPSLNACLRARMFV
jgi:hypothetical protein